MSARSRRAASFRREIARLIRVRQQDVRRIQLRDRVLQRGREAVRRVGLERRADDGDDFLTCRGGDLGRDATDRVAAPARDEDGDRCARRAGQLLRGGESFPTSRD